MTSWTKFEKEIKNYGILFLKTQANHAYTKYYLLKELNYLESTLLIHIQTCYSGADIAKNWGRNIYSHRFVRNIFAGCEALDMPISNIKLPYYISFWKITWHSLQSFYELYSTVTTRSDL